ncbi:LysR family transcriptional regulator [Enterococcus saigonensis]|uniref:LysR family transcriptional regulator n=1 Tax=Enterococcus saigonensis TaxID=1805431 RepID=A0A679IN09_9ENTE|nr:LysR family transcriptional regulator [Enterococcus saigonensis]BCA86945.1 LysR family transcriptional regulator [Enterococcus saigonensis]
MDLRVIKYFLKVVEEKNITKAADALFLSQPTLSKQLKELEEELGVQLFTRGNREITLTEAGIYLYNRSKEILSLVESTEKNLKKEKVIGGTLSIGSGETETFQWIAEILNQLLQRYAEVNVNLYSGNADDIKEKVDAGLLDFGLVIDPVDKKKYDYLPLSQFDQWGVLVNEYHPLAKKSKVSPSDLKAQRLLISSQSQVDNQLSEWLGGNLDKFKIVGSYNLLYNASLLVKESDIVALCIDGIINTRNSGLNFIPFSPPLEARTNIIWKKNQVFSNVSNKFLELLVQNRGKG